MPDAPTRFMDSNWSVISFIAFVIGAGFLYAFIIRRNTFPTQTQIEKEYFSFKCYFESYRNFFFHATAYHQLAVCHQTLHFFLRVFGSALTIVTVYCAFDNNQFLLLSALLAAVCEILMLSTDFRGISDAYREAANIMDEVFLKMGNKNESLRHPPLTKPHPAKPTQMNMQLCRKLS